MAQFQMLFFFIVYVCAAYVHMCIHVQKCVGIHIQVSVYTCVGAFGDLFIEAWFLTG